MVGVGVSGDLASAGEFVADTGVTFTMLWTDSPQTWQQLAIVSTSSMWLLDRHGNRIDNTATVHDESHLDAHLAAMSRG